MKVIPLLHLSGIDENVWKRKTFHKFEYGLNRLLSELAHEEPISGIDLHFYYAPFEIAPKPENVENGSKKSVGSSEAAEDLLRDYSYAIRDPLYTFEQLVLPASTVDAIENAVRLFEVEQMVFDVWGLRKIEPFPRVCLNFCGPPGTGKTMAAHAIASKFGRKIMAVSYADIESKYHGEGPKNIKAIFQAAQSHPVVLFIDEADSLLSKRLTSVTQASEQAINSMRSELLVVLENFRGTVIFATNLIENYDSAFKTRVRMIRFELPDEAARRLIWDGHLVSQLPRSPNVDIDHLATTYPALCGRDIKNAVIAAAVRVAIDGREQVSLDDLEYGIKATLTLPDNDTPSSNGQPSTSETVRQTSGP